MKKESKKTNNLMKMIKILTIILLIALVSMIGFFGIYKQNKSQMSNVVKNYSYAMDIKGARNIKLKLNEETTEVVKDSEGNVVEDATDEEIEEKGYTKEEVPNNAEEAKTVENYQMSKEIIEKRLKKLGIQQYNVSANSATGTIDIEIPENSNTDTIIGKINPMGKFEIIDSETKEVLLDNSHIKSSNVLYNTTTSGTAVYLEIEFNKDGKKKLEDITKTYVKSEENETSDDNTVEPSAEEVSNETVVEGENTEAIATEETVTEETDEEETKTDKQITMKIDDEDIMTTSFDEPIVDGKIQLSVGTASTEQTTIQDYVSQAQNIAVALDSGNLPLKYNLEKNEYVLSNITIENLKNVIIGVTVVAIIALIVIIVKYKFKGLLAVCSLIGLTAIYGLLVRYANVVISIESIFGIAIILILDYIFTDLLLKNINKNIKESKENIVNKATAETYKKFFVRIIPICIMVVAFCFVKWIPISSFGMIAFWGLVLIAVYNAIITRSLLKILIEDK